MAKNYKPDENGNTKCIECGQVIHLSDSYHWVKQKGTPARVIFIHKDCYEKTFATHKWEEVMNDVLQGLHYDQG